MMIAILIISLCVAVLFAVVYNTKFRHAKYDAEKYQKRYADAERAHASAKKEIDRLKSVERMLNGKITRLEEVTAEKESETNVIPQQSKKRATQQRKRGANGKFTE